MIHPYEITIGSILRTNKGDIIRVESISTKYQHRKVGYHTPDDPYHIKYVRLAQCEGIEITPEILEKNEFVQQEGDIIALYIDTPYVYAEYLKNIKRIRICADKYLCGFNVSIDVSYVHEFQHAMRLCGLRELADNFRAD